MDGADAAEAARLKREARKARILGKGSDRLARITNTGRGEGASAYTDLSSPSARSPALSPSNEDDPLEVDVSTLAQPHTYGDQSPNPFMMGAQQQQQGAMPQNPMEALMQMMQGGGGMGNGMGGGPGDQEDMMAGLPPQLAAMMQQFGGAGMGPGAGAPNVAPTTTKRKSGSERAFDFVQAALVLLLAALAAKSSLFNTDHTSPVPEAIDLAAAKSDASISAMQRWARLAYQRPSPQEWSLYSTSSLLSSASAASFGASFLSTVPLFWIFLSLEVLLQAVRIAVFSRKTPAPPSMLATLASALPIPNLGLAIRLGSKYLALINAFVNDLALLVFVMGATILWAGWQLGGPAHLDAITHALHDEL